MQQPMDAYVCGTNMSSESTNLLSLGHIYFSRDKNVPVEFWYNYFMRKVNLTKRVNFLTSNIYHKCRNA